MLTEETETVETTTETADQTTDHTEYEVEKIVDESRGRPLRNAGGGSG